MPKKTQKNADTAFATQKTNISDKTAKATKEKMKKKYLPAWILRAERASKGIYILLKISCERRVAEAIPKKPNLDPRSMDRMMFEEAAKKAERK